jgi:aspartyl/glutamyl-tRNA(Asn/Gln) amidotransferase C subunit
MVDGEAIERLARLARIDVAGTEVDALREEMRRIVAFVDGLNEPGGPEAGDDGGVQGTGVPADGPDRLPLRDDRADPSPADPLLRLAPRTRERFVVVPRVIEDPGA